jgi:pyruvate/2-oxoacid:ferredoxin oxidoreductase beta subunit
MIFVAHRAPYIATASVAFPMDLIAKVLYGKKVKGFKLLIVHSPCLTGWRYDPSKTIDIGRLDVQTGMWVLYEILDGQKFRLTYKPRELKPVSEYLKMQCRFRHLRDEEIAVIQKMATDNWEQLLGVDGNELSI